MQQVRLGRTGLSVSRLAFGTWQLGGEWGATDEEQAIAAIQEAADQGVTLFDTAQGYGFGAAERLLAKALAGYTRDEVVIATKGGLRATGSGSGLVLERDASRGWIRKGVEESLKALASDYIDLYQLHWPDLATPHEETAGVLSELVSEGRSSRHGQVGEDPIG